MRCPECGGDGRVSYSDKQVRWRKRIRFCLKCGKRYETVEVTVVGRILEFLKVWGER